MNLTGKRFGKLIVLGNRTKKKNAVLWECRCDCGIVKMIYQSNLIQGYSTSCGKCNKTGINSPSYLHGGTRSRLYGVWLNMRRRCYEVKNKRFKNYGGRGIRVCDEWQKFENFQKWAIETGYDSEADYGKCTIDRIDTNGNYEPNNCRWVNIQEQNENRTSNHYLTLNDETMTIKKWAEKLNIDRKFLENRIRNGWTDEEVLCIPYGETRKSWQHRDKLAHLSQR